MGLSLLFPLGLAALAAAVLPLLIHLARRQESRLTSFAALRWLRAQPKPRQRIRIDEWPLLLVRLLLLALLALLMAGLAWQGADDRRPRVLVSPALDDAARRTLKLPEDAKAHWLALGFPALEQPRPAAPQQEASLLREFDATLPADAPLTVIVPAVWGDVDAQRPILSRQVDWQVLPARTPDRIAPPVSAPTLAAAGFDEKDPALRTLRALNAAWQPKATALPLADAAGSSPAPHAAFVAWGADASIPQPWQDWVRTGGQLLLGARTPWPDGTSPRTEWQGDDGEVLLASAPFGHGRIWRLPQGWNAATNARLLDARFPIELARHLQPVAPPARAAAGGFAPLHQARDWPRPPPALLPGLALLIALVFALERWMATSPRRGVVA
ncbi:hypothetical protein ARC20_02020 [Stenotrophomonas panacihumi]|uniref:Aerotolerance regulator N-terminal domain-containing protein n=1 Tax=Stenotrophomonas panacihumi TaxID=676599 RepID=A0A0Q9ZXS3_9GAMM|nr:BatA domain-containing protein [Stenotrophomonas panacihumi]KRG37692.1 hypothetical protein ARC20_02020 [Stenotrophomonas panacihumi]PTN56134.1 hypothetical protein C9J98_02350 [Stenotrophomonas panacihumi]